MKENQQNTLTVILALALGVVVGANWPKIKQKIQPFMQQLEKQYGDVSFTSLGALGSQKEKIEDLFAEWNDNKSKPSSTATKTKKRVLKKIIRKK